MDEPDETPRAMEDAHAWETLHSAHTAYMAATSPSYDEVLNEVADRIQASGSIGKADIGALLFWKRLRADTPWASNLMTWPEGKVREVTKDAVQAVINPLLTVPEAASAGRGALSKLPGFDTGEAFASALLLAAAPRRMAVYDRRAQAGLESLGYQLSAARGRYGRYMALIEDLRLLAKRNEHAWLARDIDLALYWLGRPKQ